MPTSYTDQFFIIDPYNPPANGTAMNFVTYTLVDQNDDGDFDRFDNDSVNGFDIQSSWPGDVVSIDIGGGVIITYTGITFYLSDGTQVFTPNDGQVLQNGTLAGASGVTTQGPLDITDLGPPCFVAGTMIDTPDGPRAVEQIGVGDLVDTLDGGAKPVLWTGARTVVGTGDLAPIRFSAGALDNKTALTVSPNHRMLISGWRAELLFGQDEVLVAAKHLTNHDMVARVPTRLVTYHHLMFDQHEVVFAEGQASESLYPGDFIRSEDPEMQAELSTLFPDFADDAPTDWLTARYVLKRAEAQVLCGDMARLN